MGLRPPLTPHAYGTFFITGFLICHSFLDFLYMDNWAVGSHSTLSAVGQGAYGGQTPLCRRRGSGGIAPKKLKCFAMVWWNAANKQKQKTKKNNGSNINYENDTEHPHQWQ